MTPLEMRGEIAAALPATFRQVSHAKFLPNDRHLIADALMPRIEEWLGEARETTWDECVAIFDAKFFGGPTKDMVLGWLINPYRRSTP